MAEDEQLACGARCGGGPNHAQVVTAMLLLEDMENSAAEHPLIGQKAATTIGGCFFEARRFEKHKRTKQLQHFGKAGFEA